MYVWRIPLPLLASLLASIGIAAVWIVVTHLRRRVTSVVGRGILITAGVVAVILSPFLVDLMTRDELDRMAKLGVYVHYSPYIFLAPAFVVTALFVLGQLAFPRSQAHNAFHWKLKFWLTALVFAVLNVANWCSPGWCERFGFPFPYSWWSDAIIVMNGDNITAGHSSIALLVDISVFLLVVVALSRSYRRSPGHAPIPK